MFQNSPLRTHSVTVAMASIPTTYLEQTKRTHVRIKCIVSAVTFANVGARRSVPVQCSGSAFSKRIPRQSECLINVLMYIYCGNRPVLATG